MSAVSAFRDYDVKDGGAPAAVAAAPKMNAKTVQRYRVLYQAASYVKFIDADTAAPMPEAMSKKFLEMVKEVQLGGLKPAVTVYVQAITRLVTPKDGVYTGKASWAKDALALIETISSVCPQAVAD